MEKDDFTIHVLDHDQERFGAPVMFLVPSEIRDNREFDTKKRAGDGLYLSVQSTKNRLTTGTVKSGNGVTYDNFGKL